MYSESPRTLPERLQAAYRFHLKSLLFSFLALFCVHHTFADAAPLLQMPPDPRIAQMTAFMDSDKFAQDQYQYIPTFITDADSKFNPGLAPRLY